MNIEVTKFEYHQKQGYGIGGPWRDKPIWIAIVQIDENSLHFSRFDHETQWLCDAHFGKGCFPYFCHGEGSRCCIKKAATGELAALLDKMKAEYTGGLVEAYA